MYKRTILIVGFLLVGPFGHANAETWQEGTVYFNDETTVTGEIRMGKTLSFDFEGEEIEVPLNAFKSIKLLAVKKGKYVIHQQGYAPKSLLDLNLRNGIVIKTEVDTYDKYFCKGKYNFLVRAENPLTGIVEKKSYGWVSHISSTIDSNCLFHEDMSHTKRVQKVVFK